MKSTVTTNAPPSDDQRVGVPLREIRLMIGCAETALQQDPSSAVWQLFLNCLREWENLPRNIERDQKILAKAAVASYMITGHRVSDRVIEGMAAGASHCFWHKFLEEFIQMLKAAI